MVPSSKLTEATPLVLANMGREIERPNASRDILVNKPLTMLLSSNEGHSGHNVQGSRDGTLIASGSDLQFVAPPPRPVAGRLAH
jgi:hypothetical protein